MNSQRKIPVSEFPGILWNSLKTLLRFMWLYPLSLILYKGSHSRGARAGQGRHATVQNGQQQNSAGTMPEDHGTVLLLYSQVPWWGVWQRPQEQAMGLAEKRRILYVGPVQSHEPLIRYPRWQRLTRIDKGKGIVVFSPLILPGNYKWRFVFSINRLILLAELRWFLRNEPSVAFLTNSPFVDYLPAKLRFARVIYDVIDDFISFEWAPPGSREMEQRLFMKADVVITGTNTLKEDKGRLFKGAEFIPCGVAFEKFYLPSDRKAPDPPSDIRDLPRPLIGYTGTLSDRIDGSILSGIAKACPNGSLCLVGPVHRTLEDMADAPNIHYLGLKKHEELPAYLHHFKVALLPFKLTKAALAINPVKTLEYLAAGCLVVSTAIPDVVKFYSDAVVIADSPGDYIEKTLELLEGDHKERILRGIELARSYSWEKMIALMEARMGLP